ncbi:MAG: diguanylate cyclase [Candidatus Cloacimonetes bacterium]|nr:diguanylate cyclase [Candidatus Cloacimonadota bacterium]
MKRKKVMIVEDEKIIAEDIKQVLSKHGYYVSDIIDNGEDAIGRIEKNMPDLVLIDIGLSGKIDGIEAAKIIRKKFEIPTVYITALSFEQLKQLDSSESYGFISKPFKVENLIYSVKIALNKDKNEKTLKSILKKIENLNDIAHQLSKSENLDEICHLIMSTTKNILDFTNCRLVFFISGKMIVERSRGDVFNDQNCNMKIFDKIAEKTFRQQEMIIDSRITNISTNLNDDCKTKSIISIPINQDGVFQVASAKINAFQKEDINLVKYLINHAEEALKKIHLHEKLKRQAIYDSLTNVYNRHYLEEILKHEKKSAERHDRTLGFIYIDINKMKQINDRYGHHTGDKAIKIVAFLIKKEARETDYVFRIGGDEFLILAPEISEKVHLLKQRIKDRITKWNEDNTGFPFSINISIGFSSWSPKQKESIEEIIHQADELMYSEKRIS